MANQDNDYVSDFYASPSSSGLRLTYEKVHFLTILLLKFIKIYIFTIINLHNFYQFVVLDDNEVKHPILRFYKVDTKKCPNFLTE